MISNKMDQLLQHASTLTPSERLLLASRLIQSVRNEITTKPASLKWKDAAGLLPYPALGEDAQTYINRSRRAEDDHRNFILRDGK